MKLNEAVIPHYRSEMIPTSELSKLIALNKDHLKEKPTWYMIDGETQYFKIRNDFRLFTEQFFSVFGREIMGLDTLDYKVSYVSTISGNKREPAECGLLSKNFQEPGFNYYLVGELMNAEISNLMFYGGYSLETLLNFFSDYLAREDYKKNELFLIKLFIADAFTHQEDRNYNNIGFKIPKIDGVPYTKRFNTSYLQGVKNAKDHYVVLPDGRVLLKGFSPIKVYDSERILGIHKTAFSYKSGQIWCPSLPYSADTLFKTQRQAQECAEEYDGLDPNLFELYANHTEMCRPYFERLAYDDEYRRILESFKGESCQINLNDSEIEKITGLFEDKRKDFKKILTY